MNLTALTETLDYLHQASVAIGNRARLSAQVHLEDAHLSAVVAFPAGSRPSRSLLAVVGAVEAEAAAAGLLEVSV